ncbi:MAG: hypothetical protein ACUVQR_05345 [Thermogutta sp.]
MDSPNIDVQLIERIVREVLAALSSGSSSALRGTVEASSRQEPAGMEQDQVRQKSGVDNGQSTRGLARVYSARNGELTLTNKVVTVASLENRLEGIKHVVLPPGALITPAAQDMLAEKGIKVFYGRPAADAQHDSKAGLAAAETVSIILVTRSISPQQLDNLLRPEGIIAEFESLDCLVRASDRLAEVCRSGKLAVVVTRDVPAEVCLANRHAGVRAIGGRVGIDVAAETASVGANALVADVSAGLFAVKRMIVGFVRATHECPERWRERLA